MGKDRHLLTDTSRYPLCPVWLVSISRLYSLLVSRYACDPCCCLLETLAVYRWTFTWRISRNHSFCACDRQADRAVPKEQQTSMVPHGIIPGRVRFATPLRHGDRVRFIPLRDMRDLGEGNDRRRVRKLFILNRILNHNSVQSISCSNKAARITRSRLDQPLRKVIPHVPRRLLRVPLTPILVIYPDHAEPGGEAFLPYTRRSALHAPCHTSSRSRESSDRSTQPMGTTHTRSCPSTPT